MKVVRVLRLVLWLLGLATCGGCTTRALWTTPEFDNCNEPARNIHLRLYMAGPDGKILVVYDEFSQRRDSVHTRAYLLDKNAGKIRAQKRPVFVSARSLQELKPIPVFQTSNLPLSPPPSYATLSTNDQSFTLFGLGAKAQTYALPVYDDGHGKAERIALTPLTVAADATIVGGCLGYLWLESLGNSDYGYKFW
jgi:hypothetical protein